MNPDLLAAPPSHWGHWGYGSCILCWCHWRDARGVGEAGKLILLGPLLHLRGPSRLTTESAGFKAGGRPCTPLHPCTPPAVLCLPSSPCVDKKEKMGWKKG
jgi:hypothetical protein